jgi:UDP-N-acetylmuramoyl-L-alanyl-D-glutamate--2,6-diaminopimelate ligase
MRLDAIVARAADVRDAPKVQLVGDPGVEIQAMTLDSRAVTPGALFACVPGHRVDGHEYAGAAVDAGATALVVERPLGLGVPEVQVSSVRAVLGPLASALYDHPSRSLQVVGVTGTNGKTTTVSLLDAILERHGWPTATIGTLTQARTTPEAPELQARLAELRDLGLVAVALEVSSHALDMQRVDATEFAVAVLTNLTQDHLDYHGSMEAYFEAKARLFQPGRAKVAVLNGDDPYGQRLLGRLRGGATPVMVYRGDDAEDLHLEVNRSRFIWRGHPVELHLAGRFNVYNALAALNAAVAAGVPEDVAAAGVGDLRRVRGRFEAVEAGQPFTVVVDYAHTPDGLASALTAAREIAQGHVVVVFGAGGERDRSKRPLMGEVVARLADMAVLTSDNPRSEDPESIMAEVAAGFADQSKLVVQADRAEAIRAALGAAQPGDVVVIAGKGHETGQEIAGRVYPFDDVTEARRALEGRSGTRSERAES